ncbi:hypothetical protein COS66_00840 [Candidatus Berkelbacteria bacterium CG06_land_8_20_14_3_00_43_10]|nr:MAG: hypothetical protein AUK41_00320 [Candidatus Berkelbacteria bacterium CG2_30_43_20]PIU87439.1 MAG: hypothetical protein COS66_00840 [Candidatus Berkelbacteria bacterium CG06_land_8_20_14_3_00_43_10]
MDVFYKILGIINRLIWITIGIAIIFGIIAFMKVGPKNIADTISGSIVGGMSDQGDTSASVGTKQYTPQQIECFKGKVGEARVNELITNNQKPSAKEIVQIKPCLSK